MSPTGSHRASCSASCPPTPRSSTWPSFPRGRATTQEQINRIIVEAALAGRRVARFKGGDNFVFGRGFEEVLACREAGVPVTVIPGHQQPARGARPRPASRSPTAASPTT